MTSQASPSTESGCGAYSSSAHQTVQDCSRQIEHIAPPLKPVGKKKRPLRACTYHNRVGFVGLSHDRTTGKKCEKSRKKHIWRLRGAVGLAVQRLGHQDLGFTATKTGTKISDFRIQEKVEKNRKKQENKDLIRQNRQQRP